MSKDSEQLVGDEESVARFILYEKWIRKSDNTPKPDAFIPPSDLNLSVTRHIGLPEEGIWEIGQKVAHDRAEKGSNAKLEGRADLSVNEVRKISLEVQAHPLPENLNHAHITDWPIDKSARKSMAQELAAVAQYKLFM
jgi:hypothetical protein